MCIRKPDYTKWKRINFDPPPHDIVRVVAEHETNNDVRKPIQQLICDVHEEVLSARTPEENLAPATM